MNVSDVNTWENGETLAGAVEKQFADRAPRALIGWAGIIIRDPSVDKVALLEAYLKRVADESCGECTPCREGTARMREIITGICEGRGAASDLDDLRVLSTYIGLSARCDIGRTVAKPVHDILDFFASDVEAVLTGERQVERGRYDSLLTAPCINACPAHVDIPAYLEHVKHGRWVEAMTVVRSGCPMPGTIGRVCVRPCEENCRRNSLDAPLAIRGIKRFLADREQAGDLRIDEPRKPEKPEKIAVVGAGPAGLSCAYYLGRLGYTTTVFEAQEGPGGMAAYGIPSYRLPRDVIAHEVALVEALGAEIRYGVKVGKDVTVDELEDQGYQAVFLGAGAPESSAMRCTGEDSGYQGFMPGVDFLARAARGEKPLEGKRVVVIGGGNVAMDCVRTARRLGFLDVNLLYRRTEAEMPADHHEIREAKEEGVTFHFLVAPLEIMAENGVVTGLKCQRMGLGEPDASGRRRPVPVEGSEYVIDCDAVIPAVGQKCAVNQVISGEDCVTSWNTLIVDGATFQSARPEVFGGGDCATGPSSLIAALSAGRQAASFIDQYLKTGACRPSDRDVLEHLVSDGRVFDHEPAFTFSGGTVREEQPVVDPEVRIHDFQEVEKGFSPIQARIEAARCLRCYRILVASV